MLLVQVDKETKMPRNTAEYLIWTLHSIGEKSVTYKDELWLNLLFEEQMGWLNSAA